MPDFLDDLVFPDTISLYSFKGKRSRSTTVTTVRSGFDQRKSAWAQTLRTYDAGQVARPAPQWRLLDDFFDATEGMAIGFLLKDPTDYQVAQADGLLAHVAGDVYSFQKKRTVGSRTTFRAIAKPIATTVVAYRTRAGVTTVVPGSNYAIDAGNGALTFNASYVVAGDTFAWAGEFYVPARFLTDDLDWMVNDKAAFGELIISAPSIPITELRWPGLLYLPPT